MISAKYNWIRETPFLERSQRVWFFYIYGICWNLFVEELWALEITKFETRNLARNCVTFSALRIIHDFYVFYQIKVTVIESTQYINSDFYEGTMAVIFENLSNVNVTTPYDHLARNSVTLHLGSIWVHNRPWKHLARNSVTLDLGSIWDYNRFWKHLTRNSVILDLKIDK